MTAGITRLRRAAVAITITAFAGCANGATEGPGASRSATSQPRIAPELMGAWQARVPSDQERQAPLWTIELLDDGGIGNAPALVYSDETGVHGALSYEVAGNRITVTDDKCSTGPTEAVFSFVIESGRLTFERRANDCPEKVVEHLLTARPWRRVQD